MSISLNAAAMRAVDKFSIEETGIDGCVLMERAALKTVERILEDNPDCKRACVVYGGGNNGGDGLAAGRMLALAGWSVTAFCATNSGPTSDLCKKQYYSAEKCGVKMIEAQRLEEELKCENIIFIDAIFGIGCRRNLEGDTADTVNLINEAGVKVYSVDVPSGISSDTGAVMGTAVKAYATVTYGYMKHGLLMYPGAEYAGKVYVEDAGFSVTDAEAFAKANGEVPITYFKDSNEIKLPERFAVSNKGSYGKLLIIGGSEGCAGAAFLAAYSAYMSGVGMVKVLTCKDTVAVLNVRMPEIMTGLIFKENGETDTEVLREGIDWATDIVIGPGLGKSQAAAEVVRIVAACGKPVVVDADALNIIADQAAGEPDKISAMFAATAVLTPHMGELSRLTGVGVRTLKSTVFDTALQYTYNNKLTYVCKDARTVVASEGKLHININGNSGMSTAGAGDVLAGLIGGLMAAGLEPYEAARTGVYIHALSGDAAAAAACEDCVTASAIADKLADCISILRHR